MHSTATTPMTTTITATTRTRSTATTTIDEPILAGLLLLRFASLRVPKPLLLLLRLLQCLLVYVRSTPPLRLLGVCYDDYDGEDDSENRGTPRARMNTTVLVTIALPLIYFWLEVVVTVAMDILPVVIIVLVVLTVVVCPSTLDGEGRKDNDSKSGSSNYVASTYCDISDIIIIATTMTTTTTSTSC